MRAELFQSIKETFGVQQITNGHRVRFLCPADKALAVEESFRQLAAMHGYADFTFIPTHHSEQGGTVVIELISNLLTHANAPKTKIADFIPILGKSYRSIVGLPELAQQVAPSYTLPTEKISIYHQIKTALGNRYGIFSGASMRFSYHSDEVSKISQAFNKLAAQHGYKEFATYQLDHERTSEPRGVLDLNKMVLLGYETFPAGEAGKAAKAEKQKKLSEFIKLLGETERKVIKEIQHDYEEMLKKPGNVIFGIDTTQHIPTGYVKEVEHRRRISEAKLEAAGFSTEEGKTPGSGFRKLLARNHEENQRKLKALGFGHLVTCSSLG